MARAIGFNYDVALDRATRLFWKHGYAQTSLRELLKVMGIGESSFYNTLKSKKQLYLECLTRYEDTEGRKRGLALMSAATAGRGIRDLIGVILDCLDDPHTPSRLCMMAAMASEDVLADADLRRFVEDRMSNLRNSLVGLMLRDKGAGLLPATFDPEAVAPVVVTYLQGLWRVALLSYDRPRCEREVDLFLTAIGL